jgi:hypothetical protein
MAEDLDPSPIATVFGCSAVEPPSMEAVDTMEN